MIIRPRTTSLLWTGATYSAGSDWTGTVALTTSDVPEHVYYPNPKSFTVEDGVLTVVDNGGFYCYYSSYW